MMNDDTIQFEGAPELENGSAALVRLRSIFTTTATAAVTFFAGAHIALAQVSQQDYLKKISENISAGGSSDSGSGGGMPNINSTHLLAFVVMIAAVLLLLVWWNNRQQRPKKVKHVNHSRKLFRQIGRQMGLAGDEIKQLKVLADVHEREKGQPLESPLTLLLCPSLLTRSMEIGDVKIDRQVIARMAKRISQKPRVS